MGSRRRRKLLTFARNVKNIRYLGTFERKRDINSRTNFVYQVRGSTSMDVLNSWLRIALVALLGTLIIIGCADTGGGGEEAAAPAEEPATVEATELVAAEGGEEAEAAEEAAEEGMGEEAAADDAAAEEGDAEMADAEDAGDDGGEGEAAEGGEEVPATELAPAE